MSKKIKHRQTRLPKSSSDKTYPKRNGKPARKLTTKRDWSNNDD